MGGLECGENVLGLRNVLGTDVGVLLDSLFERRDLGLEALLRQLDLLCLGRDIRLLLLLFGQYRPELIELCSVGGRNM